MKPPYIAIACAFSFAVTNATGAEIPPAARPSSVAEMLQRKQEHQMRDQLLKEGRVDEVRELDEAQLRRQQLQTKRSLTKLNSELARETTVTATVNGDGVVTFCPPASAVTRMESVKNRPASVSTAGGARTNSD